ncbi:MAG: transpeptidase family protein [Bacteroidia bacterium]|nr:transpeptidase family protein [Bacteroidia bacterium]
MDRKNELLIRVYFVFFTFVLMALVILGKVVKTSLLEGEKWREQGGKNIKWIEVAGERGNIYDTHGNILATTLPYFDIYVDLVTSSEEDFKTNIGPLSVQLAAHFGKTAHDWKSELSAERKAGVTMKKPGSRYYPLLKRVSKDQLDLLKTMPLFNLGKHRGGLLYERKNSREKPFKNLAYRTIGLDRKNADKIGIEGSFDEFLSGETEKRLMRRLPGDIWLPVVDPELMSQQRGGDIVTTLDMHIQDIVHHELLEVLHKYDADAGSVVIMDVKTGAIKAMSNLGKVDEGLYREEYNYAVGRLSEPGSTFKLISAMALLETGKVELDDDIVVNGGKKKFFDRWMRDSEMHGNHTMTFEEVFEHSSNVGMANAAYAAYGKKSQWPDFMKAINNLGAMDKTGIRIQGERAPFFKDPESFNTKAHNTWSGTTVPWMAHGYELTMTPLQVLNFYNSVANDGTMMKPYLVKEIYEDGKRIKRIEPQVVKQSIASPSTVMKARRMLEGVAESGTAQRLKVKNTSFAGKTGTTRLNYWKTTSRKEYNASFAGYFPVDNPQYSAIVVVYNPKGAYYGSQVAGPVFRNIVQRLAGLEYKEVQTDTDTELPVLKAHSGYKKDYTKVLEYIGLGYDDKGKNRWVMLESDSESLEIEDKKILKKSIPDVKGMGLRDAVYVLESLGLEVEHSGMGKVYRQSIKTGTVINGQTIKIYLK